MSDITKEALKERGFISTTDFGHSLQCYEVKILVYLNEHILFVEIQDQPFSDSYTVPNCKTLEDLDQLIRLFQ